MHRYHPLLVTLHWFVGLLIVALLFAGEFLLSQTPNSAPAKIFTLRVHMSVGTLILFLMGVRLFTRLRAGPPMATGSGATIWDRAVIWMHWALYAAVVLVALSGMMLAMQAGSLAIVFGGSNVPLPPTFALFPAAMVHAVLCDLLNVLILGHVAAFLWHAQAGGGAKARMWYERGNGTNRQPQQVSEPSSSRIRPVSVSSRSQPRQPSPTSGRRV